MTWKMADVSEQALKSQQPRGTSKLMTRVRFPFTRSNIFNGLVAAGASIPTRTMKQVVKAPGKGARREQLVDSCRQIGIGCLGETAMPERREGNRVPGSADRKNCRGWSRIDFQDDGC
jgi:hypothetical protein